jgi:predicted dehydrogenase
MMAWTAAKSEHPMPRLAIAVLGAGNRAADYLRTITCLTEHFRPVAVCDTDLDRAARLAAEYGTPAFSGIKEILAEARPKPDLLLVSIPADGHRAAVEIAAECGVHVVCETPIAPTLPLADAMIATCERNGVKLEVAENVWRWPRERLKQRIIQSGLIGEVTQLHLWYSTGSYHGIGAVRRLVGHQPVRVHGFVQEVVVPPHVDRLGNRLTTAPYELGLIEFAGGAICVYQQPLHPHKRNHWDVIGRRGAIIGDELILVDDGKRQVFPIRSGGERVMVETDPPIIWENPFQNLAVGPEPDDIARAEVLLGMHRAITAGGEPSYGAANARMDQEVLIAIRESALRDGTWIDLPLRETTEVERRAHDQYHQRYGHDPLGPGVALSTLYPSATPTAAALTQCSVRRRDAGTGNRGCRG